MKSQYYTCKIGKGEVTQEEVDNSPKSTATQNDHHNQPVTEEARKEQ